MISFKYEPLTDQQIQELSGRDKEFPLLPEGDYDFTVTKATLKMSNTGVNSDPNKPSNPMIALNLTFWDKSGKEYFVYDNLIGTKSMTWKTKQFCDSTGLSTEYEQEKFNETYCEGRSGKAHVGIKKGDKKDNGTSYKDKNEVKKYLLSNKVAPMKPLTTPTPNQVADEFFNDDVPF